MRLLHRTTRKLSLTDAKAYDLSHRGVARTFQNLRLFGRLTVRDNVLVALDRSRIWWSWRYIAWPVGVVTAALGGIYLGATTDKNRGQVMGMRGSAISLAVMLGPLAQALVGPWITPQMTFAIGVVLSLE